MGWVGLGRVTKNGTMREAGCIDKPYCIAVDPPASFRPVPIITVTEAPNPVPPEQPLRLVDDPARFCSVDKHAAEVRHFGQGPHLQNTLRFIIRLS